MFSVFKGLYRDAKITHLFVSFSFLLNLPPLFLIQLAFSCIFQSYFQQLSEKLPGLVVTMQQTNQNSKCVFSLAQLFLKLTRATPDLLEWLTKLTWGQFRGLFWC